MPNGEGQVPNAQIGNRKSGFVISLLPALPDVWPNGKVTGLRARGGFTVDVGWRDGKVTSYRITATEARAVKVRLNGKVKTVKAEVVAGKD